jgi:hypothetical protein
MNNYLNIDNINNSFKSYLNAQPFNHCVVDDFLVDGMYNSVLAEFKDYDWNDWFIYDNPLEHKKAQNNWNMFGVDTYKLFFYLNSDIFVNYLSNKIGVKLYSDPGLHGGGWHIHGSGGNLNPHLDYSIHPKLGLERKVNIIIYVSPTYNEIYGGHLGLWNGSNDSDFKGSPVKEIFPIKNRAVIFDTTQNSWHGMSRKFDAPKGIFRRSLAVYYLCEPSHTASLRKRALYAPTEDQINDSSINKLIMDRVDLVNSTKVYR